ncbi:MAG: hypothetical protein VXY90_13710, partial [Pseudomonadota bacterium]|nr:hypothetical protein [Pseudomonadota bacterium]
MPSSILPSPGGGCVGGGAARAPRRVVVRVQRECAQHLGLGRPGGRALPRLARGAEQHAPQGVDGRVELARPARPREADVVVQLGLEALGALGIVQVLHVAMQLARARGGAV